MRMTAGKAQIRRSKYTVVPTLPPKNISENMKSDGAHIGEPNRH